MMDKVKRSIRYASIMILALGPLPSLAIAQERENAAETIQNVQLIFHLVQADGFTEVDPEISDVVAELRKLFSFQGYRLLSTSMLNVGLSHLNIYNVSGSGSQRIVADGFEEPLAIKAELTARRSTRVVRATVILTDDLMSGRAAVTGGNVISIGSTPLLEASVSIRDGQRVVLGSARRSADEPVLILVVTPRIDPT